MRRIAKYDTRFKAAEPTLHEPTRSRVMGGAASIARRYARGTDLSSFIFLFHAPFSDAFAPSENKLCEQSSRLHGGVNDRQFVRADHFRRMPKVICSNESRLDFPRHSIKDACNVSYFCTPTLIYFEQENVPDEKLILYINVTYRNELLE